MGGIKITPEGISNYIPRCKMKKSEMIRMHEAEQSLKAFGAILEDEKVEGMHNSLLFLDTIGEVERILAEPDSNINQTVTCSIEMYDAIREVGTEDSEAEVEINTKYKQWIKRLIL